MQREAERGDFCECSGPLPEDLFSGLDELSLASPGTPQSPLPVSHAPESSATTQPSVLGSGAAASPLIRQVRLLHLSQ